MKTQPITVVSRVRLQDGSDLPEPRTYHACCLVNKYMVVVGGEAYNTDMNDIWALDLETLTW